MTTPVETATSSVLPVISEHIATTPGLCGGKPHIVGHRIKVQHIVQWKERLGMTPDEIVASHPGLTLGDVYAALAYYWDHREQIDNDIRAGEEFANRLRAGAPSIFEKAQHKDAKDDPVSPG